MKHEDREKIENRIQDIYMNSTTQEIDFMLLQIEILLDIRDCLQKMSTEQGHSKWGSKL